MHSSVLLAALSLGALTPASPTRSPNTELQVETSSGLVQGIYNDTSHSVRAFLGIPYAEPPTNEHRWAPPRPKSAISLSTPINASSFSAPCPQAYSTSNESIWSILPYEIWNAPEMSEDCLSVNVWTPSTQASKSNEKKAVLLFIHSGGFTTGGGSIGFYDGSNLVRDQGIYQLNIFGYPNAPGLQTSEQNVGFLDQRLAIEWVHANIANFGGDPDRILLFGQSASAASVDGYAYAYPDDPLVSAFVMESGTVSLFDNGDTEHANWNELSTSLNCGSGPESLDCMRSLPCETTIEGMNSGSYTFTPVVDNTTPTLAGVNAREFSAGFPLSQTSINETEVFEDLYSSFACPAQVAVRTRLNSSIPTWRYVYHGNFTNLSPRPWLGAYHSSELPILFGTYNQTYLPPRPGKDEIGTSRYIQDAWVSFAKDTENGLAEYGWPEFSYEEDTLVNLAVHNEPGKVLSSSEGWDKHCDGSKLIS